jgi:SAM-dependent methyltransferase
MPSSQHLQLNELVDTILTLNPESVLDIGVGFGKYGMLIREYLDPNIGNADHHRRVRLDGIEIFTPYITPIQRSIYDNIYPGDALEILPILSTRYDLILLIDVLEHFDEQRGSQLITHCLEKGTTLLISTPHNPGPQLEAYGNPAERHVKRWNIHDLKKFGPLRIVPNLFSLICVLGSETIASPPRKNLKRRIIEWIYRWGMYLYYD